MEKFYELMGKICYCAAKADNVIKMDEIDKMNDLLMDYWAEHHQTIVDSFYACINNNYDDKKIIDDVTSIKQKSPEIFTSVMIDQIMQTAYKIVASYSGTNKSEIVYISRLRNALEA